LKNKFKTLHELKATLDAIKKTGNKVVFTNGCFDLLHVGHTRYLKEAKLIGDYLVIAINSDSSVRGLKGDKRPIVPEAERVELLAALDVVDFVTIFDEPDPYNVINELKPDFLVKGGDWGEGEIIGSDIVIENGGKVVSLPYIEGSSSTNIVETIIERYCGG